MLNVKPFLFSLYGYLACSKLSRLISLTFTLLFLVISCLDVEVRWNLETGAGVTVAPTPDTQLQRVGPGEQNCSGDLLKYFIEFVIQTKI